LRDVPQANGQTPEMQLAMFKMITGATINT